MHIARVGLDARGGFTDARLPGGQKLLQVIALCEAVGHGGLTSLNEIVTFS